MSLRTFHRWASKSGKKVKRGATFRDFFLFSLPEIREIRRAWLADGGKERQRIGLTPKIQKRKESVV